MSDGERIGVFGGTFDPIHQTHLDIAHAVMAHAALDSVLFVVSATPPHKRGEVFATPDQRFRMVQAALEGEAQMAACDLELKRLGPSYTADTLEALRALHPTAEFFLILGQDSLADLPFWHAPERIMREARVLAVARPGPPPQLPPMLHDKCDWVPFPENWLSSTTVRDRLARDAEVNGMLPPPVLRIIRAEGLYHAHR